LFINIIFAIAKIIFSFEFLDILFSSFFVLLTNQTGYIAKKAVFII